MLLEAPGAVLEARKGSAEAHTGSTGAQAGLAGIQEVRDQPNLAPKKVEKVR